MRKILMFVGTFAVIFMLAACGNGVQKETSEKYSAAEVEPVSYTHLTLPTNSLV